MKRILKARVGGESKNLMKGLRELYLIPLLNASARKGTLGKKEQIN